MLDNFAKTKKNDEIFHLTADECVSTDEEEIDNTINFITKYRNEVEGELLGELFDYILETMRRKSNYYPYMILGEFFDEVTKN